MITCTKSAYESNSIVGDPSTSLHVAHAYARDGSSWFLFERDDLFGL
jgi:hypothetical protein